MGTGSLYQSFHNLKEQYGSSLLVVAVLFSALYIAAQPQRLESMSQIESWFSVNDERKQYVLINFSAPTLQVLQRDDGSLCTQIYFAGMKPETAQGTPRLPRTPVAISKPDELAYESLKVVGQKSERLNLTAPLCYNPSYKVDESFIDPNQRGTELTLDNSKGTTSALPFPAQIVKLQQTPKRGSSQALHLLVYPVTLHSSTEIEIRQQLTIQINYQDDPRRLGLKTFTPNFSFSIPTTTSLRVRVANTGAYVVSGTPLSSIPGGTDPDSVQVWRRDQQLAREVVHSGGTITAIRFIVPPFSKTYFEDEAVVWIRWGNGTGIDFAQVDADPALLAAGTSTYQQTDHIQQFSRSWTSLPFWDGTTTDGDKIPPSPDHGYAYWRIQYVPGPFSSVNYSFTPLSRAVAGSEVTLRPYVRGISYYAIDPDHRAVFALNGTTVGEVSFDDQEYVTPSFSLTTTLLSGSNTFNVNLPGGIISSGYESLAFYGFDVTYWREMAAIDNYLAFNLISNGSYTIKDFSSGSNLRLFHQDDSGVVTELNNLTTTDQGDGTYHLKFATTLTGRLYALQDFLTPQSVEVDTPSALQQITDGYHYIVVAGKGLLSGAEALAEHRRSNSRYAVTTIDVQDIYDEYSYGEISPQAIRDFLKAALQNWQTKPRYLFLVGASNNDPLGNLSGANRHPPLPFYFDITTYLAIPNDSRFAYLTSIGPVPDLAVGRLPVTSNTQIATYLDKLAAYEAANESDAWTSRLTIINDNFNSPSETWEQPFIDLMNWVKNASNTPADYQITHHDLIATDGTTVKNNLNSNFDDGLLFLLYMGHSSTTGWAAEQILTSTTVGSLNGATPALPLVASMTCLTGAFNTAGTTSLAEALINAESKGAIGVLASSGMTEPYPQELFTEVLLARSYAQGKPIGAVLKEARELLEVEGMDPDVARSYNYFGDPGLRIRFKAPLVDELPEDATDSGSTDDPSSTTGGGDGSGASTGGSGEVSTTPQAGNFFGCGAITTIHPINHAHVGWTITLLIGLLALYLARRKSNF